MWVYRESQRTKSRKSIQTISMRCKPSHSRSHCRLCWRMTLAMQWRSMTPVPCSEVPCEAVYSRDGANLRPGPCANALEIAPAVVIVRAGVGWTRSAGTFDTCDRPRLPPHPFAHLRKSYNLIFYGATALLKSVRMKSSISYAPSVEPNGTRFHHQFHTRCAVSPRLNFAFAGGLSP